MKRRNTIRQSSVELTARDKQLPSRVRMLIGIRRRLTGRAERIRIDFRRKQCVSRDPLAAKSQDVIPV